MPTLREVITRFRFESDERDFQNFNNRLSTMKGGLRSLAAAFGVTLGIGGAVAIAKMGLSAERAEFNLKRLSGSNFDRLRDIFKSVNKEMEILRTGASGIFHERQFDEAAANFVRVFGTGQRELDAFGRLWAFSAKQAALTGDSVVDIAGALQNAIASGGFDALLDLPGFTQYRKQLLEFQQQAMDPGEPGGAIAIQNRMRAILRIVQESSGEQAKALREVPATLLTADRATNKMQEALEKLGDSIIKTLVPALQRLVELLDAVVGKFVEIDKKAAKAGVSPGVYALGEAYAKAGQAITNLGEATPSPLPSLFGPELPGQEQVGPVEGMRNRLRYLGYGAPSGTLPETTKIEFNNQFNIRSTEPMAAAREVAKKIQESISGARDAMPPTDRR